MAHIDLNKLVPIYTFGRINEKFYDHVIKEVYDENITDDDIYAIIKKMTNGMSRSYMYLEFENTIKVVLLLMNQLDRPFRKDSVNELLTTQIKLYQKYHKKYHKKYDDFSWLNKLKEKGYVFDAREKLKISKLELVGIAEYKKNDIITQKDFELLFSTTTYIKNVTNDIDKYLQLANNNKLKITSSLVKKFVLVINVLNLSDIQIIFKFFVNLKYNFEHVELILKSYKNIDDAFIDYILGFSQKNDINITNDTKTQLLISYIENMSERIFAVNDESSINDIDTSTVPESSDKTNDYITSLKKIFNIFNKNEYDYDDPCKVFISLYPDVNVYINIINIFKSKNVKIDTHFLITIIKTSVDLDRSECCNIIKNLLMTNMFYDTSEELILLILKISDEKNIYDNITSPNFPDALSPYILKYLKMNITKNIVTLAVQLNNNYLIKYIVENDKLNLIDQHIGFKYACLNNNDFLINHYLLNKFLPKKEHLYFVNENHIIQKIQLFKKFGLILDNDVYEYLYQIFMSIPVKLLKNTKLNELILEIIPNDIKFRLQHKFDIYYLASRDLNTSLNPDYKSLSDCINMLSLRKILLHMEKSNEQIRLDHCERSLFNNNLIVFEYFHDTYNYIPDTFTLMSLQSQHLRYLYLKRFYPDFIKTNYTFLDYTGNHNSNHDKLQETK